MDEIVGLNELFVSSDHIAQIVMICKFSLLFYTPDMDGAVAEISFPWSQVLCLIALNR